MQARRTFLAAAAAVGLMLAPGLARAQFYLTGEIGAVFASGPDLVGRDNDRAPVCDEFINPLFADVPGCTDPVRPGDSWMGQFDGAVGVLAGVGAGYSFRERFPGRLPGRFRLEVEYFHSGSAFDQDEGVDVQFSSGPSVTADQTGEYVLSEDRLGRFAGRNVFGNLYFDFFGAGRFTPWVGFGGGVGFVGVDYGALGLLNGDPARITSGADLPNADQIRRNLAGTVISEQADLDDTLFGYQVLFGVDYALAESVSLGVKGRWVDFDTFRDGGEWDRLRSHESQLRLDGSEPVAYEIELGGVESFGVSLHLKYHF